MTTKYLADGRKVFVVETLNSTESIVQEIFITEDGKEVSGPDKFVTKGLLDEPVLSYRQKQENISIVQAEKAKAVVKELEGKIKELKEEIIAQKNLLVASKHVVNAFGEKEAERISQFMTGQIQYLVVYNYEICPPIKMVDKIIKWETDWGNRVYDSIKLVSILGSSGGDLSYKIHQYRDGSGSGWDECYPCLTREEAVAKIKELAIAKLIKNHLSEKEFDLCINGLGITFDTVHVDQYIQCSLSQIQHRINNATQLRDKAVEELTSHQEKFNKLKSTLNTVQQE